MSIRIFVFFILIFGFSNQGFTIDYYKRHYIILVDQTNDIQVREKRSFGKVYSFLKSNFLGNGDNSFMFDETTDEISLYSFALIGDGTPELNGIYKQIHSLAINGQCEKAYKTFVSNLIENQSSFSVEKTKGVTLEAFLDKKMHPLFDGRCNHYQKLEKENGHSVTFSKYVYPIIIEKEHFDFTKPTSEYIIIIASNFQSGLDDIGTSQDRTALIEMLGEKNSNDRRNYNYFANRFSLLSEPFYQIPLFRKEFQSSVEGKNALPSALGFKLGLRTLQGVSSYITSNIDIKQNEYRSSLFRIGSTTISFNHNENLAIDSIRFVVGNSNGKEIYHCIINNNDYHRDCNTQSYIFHPIEIDLNTYKRNDTLLFKYIFFSSVKNDTYTIMPMAFVADRSVVLAESVFHPEFTLLEKMALIFGLIAFIALAFFAWMAYNKRGKSVLRGVNVKIWHVSNSRFMELQDYHVVDRDCWYMRRGEKQRLINITGAVDVQKISFARPYQLKVEYRIDDVDNNEDFSFRPDGQESTGEYKIKSKWYEVPLKSDGTFELNALVYQVDGKTPDLESWNNILDMLVTVKAYLYKGEKIIDLKEDTKYYHFIVRPEISNAALWMAFDPGTSGACVAYGIGGNPTDKTNIKIAYNTEIDSSGKETQVSIFPSKIKIPDESSIITEKGNVDISTLKEAPKYKAEGDFYFGNLARVHEGRNSFQSIKKLLGYNDMHVLLDEHRQEICKLSGRDLALLLVKGLCNHFEQYIRTNPEVSDKDRDLFIQNGTFAPSRAIVAVPNNYTIVKAQDMVDSIKRTGLFKEVHYLYEAEGVMMCYLRNKWDDITNNPRSYEEEGKFFVVFDMGGATINTTAFSMNVITAQNRGNRYIREIELSTNARVGYNVGGDDIDFSWIRILYQIPAVDKFLTENNIEQEDHIKQHRTGILKYVQKLKLDWIERLSQPGGLSDEDVDRLWMDISSDNGLPEFGIELPSQIDSESAEYIRKEWDARSVMNKYVFSAVENAIKELLSTIGAKNIEIIFSGRTSLYPGIRQTVIRTIKSELKLTCLIWDGFENANTGKSIDEVVKTAVATGACWYAMFSNLIKLKHNIVTSTFGYVDLENGESKFIPLIKRGAKLDELGKLTSNPNYTVLTPNLPNVRILQMLTSQHEVVMKGLNSENKLDNDKVKHLVNQLAHLTSNEIDGELKGVVISVDDKNNFNYQVNIAGGKALTGSGTVNDADIKTENSDAYAFSAMPCTEDETNDKSASSTSDSSSTNEESTDNGAESKQTVGNKLKGKKHF